jgi:stage II sporulation protein P
MYKIKLKYRILIVVLLLIVSSSILKNVLRKNNWWEEENVLTFNEGLDELQYIYPKEEALDETFIPTFQNISSITNFEDMQRYLYTIDKTAFVLKEELDLEGFTKMDLSSDLQGELPKILIFHTHSQEYFIDSRENEEDDSIVGVGRVLAKILVDKYNIPVIHDVGQYDVVDGKIQRGNSYEIMEPAITRILKKYPSIEVLIDLHRDGVPDTVRLVTEIEGKQTAKIMFFNGITRENNEGEPKELPSLVNPYIKENLALSLQLQLTANELYPSFARRIYIKAYRYSLHMLPKSMLVEVGANTNTLEEAKNAMEPLSKIIFKVLSK